MAQVNAEKKKQEGIEERRKILAEGGVKGFEKIIPREERLEKALLALSMQKVRDSGKIALITSRKLVSDI